MKISYFYSTPIGKKIVMAVTGIILFIFVLFHMLGNLIIYSGPERYNGYAEHLRKLGEPFLGENQFLWIARTVLLIALILHIHSAWAVSKTSWDARKKPYHVYSPVQLDYAARTMKIGGVIILLFVIYHLAHFTFGFSWAHPNFIKGDVYHNVVVGFSVWWVSAIYIVAQLALAMHLYHGLWSLFQTIGITANKKRDWRRNFAILFALLIAIGNISIPISVLLGIVK